MKVWCLYNYKKCLITYWLSSRNFDFPRVSDDRGSHNFPYWNLFKKFHLFKSFEVIETVMNNGVSRRGRGIPPGASKYHFQKIWDYLLFECHKLQIPILPKLHNPPPSPPRIFRNVSRRKISEFILMMKLITIGANWTDMNFVILGSKRIRICLFHIEYFSLQILIVTFQYVLFRFHLYIHLVNKCNRMTLQK